jgi:predicted oxidoreductase
LKNLGLFSVDYLFLHCYDYETPLEETLEVCDTLWRKEKLQNFGISNFSYDQIKELLKYTEKDTEKSSAAWKNIIKGWQEVLKSIEISLQLNPGQSLVGFADAESPLKLRQNAMAAIEQNAVVIATIA